MARACKTKAEDRLSGVREVQGTDLFLGRAAINMVVHNADRLHVRIGGRRANKLKSTLLECLREGGGFGRRRRKVADFTNR